MNSIFINLNNKIQKVLIQKKITNPTEPQKLAFPYILKGENTLLIAPTGLGKTEAALLPIFNNFLESQGKEELRDCKGFSIIYITPLRALNRDMLRRTIEWGKNLGITIGVRHGDTTQSERNKQSRNPPDMLITTPETFQILFTGKNLRRYLSKTRWLIVDEIHELAEDERGAQLSVALERLYELTKDKKHEFQRIGLSATVGSPEEVALFLGGNIKNKNRQVKIVEVDIKKHIDIKVELPKIIKTDYENAKKYSIEPISFSALRYSYEKMQKHVSTLLFINTRDGAEILASRFNQWKNNPKIGVHHGSLSKYIRIESEDNFKEGKIKSLICTSSLELGIDVGSTDFVIQYNSPRQVKRIIQRVGRSGHQIGKTSKGLIITTSAEDLAESLVIAKKALKGEIEKLKVRQNPLSVLTNQIISITLEYGKINDKKIYQIIKRAYPFHSLKEKNFNQILNQLKNQRNIWIDDEKNIIKRKNSRLYFLDNISMIPDEKTYMAVDISSRKKIGKLDESFVLNYVFEGAKFILKGKPWTIIKKEDEEILVSQSKDIGNIPSWTGEDIPIPLQVAKEVGKLRRTINLNKKIKDYPCKKETLNHLYKQIQNQKKQGFIVPDDKTITIEYEEKNIVINACFGTKVNETLGRLISAILAQYLGETIGINSDAYRINLELPGRIKPEQIIKIIEDLQPETLEYLLNTILKNSTYIRWQLVHVARKFGAIQKEYDFKNIGTKKLFTIFDNNLIIEESIDKTIWDRMDIENTKKILNEIKSKKIKIKTQKLSPISVAGLESIKGLMLPKRADRSILLALKRRLENTDITYVCINCNKKWNTTVKRSEMHPKCPKCRAIKIIALKRYNKDLAKLLTKKNKTQKEKKELKRLIRNSSLVLSYGKYAVLALMGRGIGPETAARILRRYNIENLEKNEETQLKFLKDILKAELNYARTRGFWDNT